MLKVKKAVRNPKNKSQDNDLMDLQNDIKSSIKNLYINDKKKKEKKTINEYAELVSKIRNEYAQLQRENNELKIELQKYQNYVQKNTQ